MTGSKEGVPAALLHNLKHNQMLHERVALVTVETTDTPYVNDLHRLYLHRMEKGFMRIVIRYGFMEDPDIPQAPWSTASAWANPSRSWRPPFTCRGRP